MRDALRLTVWAVLGFTPGVIAAQSDTAGRAAAVRELKAMGSLELKGAMHGPAPMVVLLTEATIAAPQSEREYRHVITTQLISALQRGGYSHFSLGPGILADSQYTSLEAYERRAERALTLLEQAGMPDRGTDAIIGFWEGAIIGARLARRWPKSIVQVALVPSLPVAGPDSGRRGGQWEAMVGTDRSLSLLIHSPCIGQLPPELNKRPGYLHPVLVMGNYDAWLYPMIGGSCATPYPRRAETAGHTFIPIVVNWLAVHLVFFE